jgi:hypothetical protein
MESRSLLRVTADQDITLLHRHNHNIIRANMCAACHFVIMSANFAINKMHRIKIHECNYRC